MSFFAEIIAWLNIPVNFLGKTLLAPIGAMPGWLSDTIISAFVGVLLLLLFKYTSNQKAIGRVRDDIKAQLLAMKLFKDNIPVVLRAQGRIFLDALLLLFHSLQPILVMVIPLCLILGQLGLWYQARPLKIGEETVVTVQLAGAENDPWPQISLDSSPAAEVTGPVRIFSKRQVCWKIKAIEKGYHRLNLRLDSQQVDKKLAVGEGFMRVSVARPSLDLLDVMVHPAEKPFGENSPVQSVRIDYPARLSEIRGTNSLWIYIRKNWWWIYFFVASMVFALIFKPFFNVRI
jgi:hypothetical protein